MKISVAMCTYNGEPYLQAQLDSIAAQTRLPDELVICDDASTDRSADICKEFADHAGFTVRVYVNQQNLGVGKNFEQATAMCMGDIIAFSDQDDIWKPEKLERTEAVLGSRSDIALLFTNAEVIDENAVALGYDLWESARFRKPEQDLINQGDALSVILNHVFVYGCTMAFRAQYKEIVLPFPENTSCIHDIWIVLLLSAIGKILPLPEQLIQYRRHAAQPAGAAPPSGYFQTRLVASQRTDPAIYLDRATYVEYACNRLQARLAKDRCEQAIAKMTPYIAHLRVRGSLPRRRLSRVLIIIKELSKLHYHRYSSGFLSAGKDLIL